MPFEQHQVLLKCSYFSGPEGIRFSRNFYELSAGYIKRFHFHERSITGERLVIDCGLEIMYVLFMKLDENLTATYIGKVAKMGLPLPTIR